MSFGDSCTTTMFGTKIGIDDEKLRFGNNSSSAFEGLSLIPQSLNLFHVIL